MKTSKIIISALLVCLFSKASVAQIDPHFSQYYAYPLLLNPALTGVIDGDYRVSLNAKQQWGAIDNSYLTGAASFDMAPTKQLAFGATILNQSAGDIDFNYLNALASASYRVRFGSRGLNILNFGLQAGIINKSFDASKITLGNQFDPSIRYNPGMQGNENIASNSSLVPDVNAGIMYFDGNPEQTLNVFAGASAAHLTRPVDKFLGNKERIPIRYTGHGGMRIKVSDMLDVTPNALYMTQGNAEEISAGAYAQLMLNHEANLLFGSNYRFDDAAIAFLGLNIKNLVLGLSYDMNTSSLRNVSRRNGGFELSIAFTSRKGIVGPNFFCPRL